MISISDERLVERYFDAEKARITCEPLDLLGSFKVGSKSDASRSHFVKATEREAGDVVLGCSCQVDVPGEPRPCAHMALAAADYSEAFRLRVADERDRRRLEELRAYRDGSLSRRSLAGQIRSLEKRFKKVDEPLTRLPEIDDQTSLFS